MSSMNSSMLRYVDDDEKQYVTWKMENTVNTVNTEQTSVSANNSNNLWLCDDTAKKQIPSCRTGAFLWINLPPHLWFPPIAHRTCRLSLVNWPSGEICSVSPVYTRLPFYIKASICSVCSICQAKVNSERLQHAPNSVPVSIADG